MQSAATGHRPPTPAVSMDEIDELLNNLSMSPQTVRVAQVVNPNPLQELKFLREDFEAFKAKVSKDLKNLQGQVTKILQILILLQSSDLGFRDVKEEITGISTQFRELSERQKQANALIEKFTASEKDAKLEKESK